MSFKEIVDNNDDEQRTMTIAHLERCSGELIIHYYNNFCACISIDEHKFELKYLANVNLRTVSTFK